MNADAHGLVGAGLRPAPTVRVRRCVVMLDRPGLNLCADSGSLLRKLWTGGPMNELSGCYLADVHRFGRRGAQRPVPSRRSLVLPSSIYMCYSLTIKTDASHWQGVHLG